MAAKPALDFSAIDGKGSDNVSSRAAALRDMSRAGGSIGVYQSREPGAASKETAALHISGLPADVVAEFQDVVAKRDVKNRTLFLEMFNLWKEKA